MTYDGRRGPCLEGFQVHYPLEAIERNRDRYRSRLHAGDADVSIRYATGRKEPKEDVAEKFLSDSYWPICSPQFLPPAGGLRSVADLEQHVLVHSYWSPADIEPPTWQRWLAIARRKWRSLLYFKEMQRLSFREELHAIEAVISGQGIGIFSNVLVASELASGKLIKVFDLSLPGYHFYVVRRRGHARKIIRAFSAWLRSVK